jgi:hypothetical protein
MKLNNTAAKNKWKQKQAYQPNSVGRRKIKNSNAESYRHTTYF